MDDTDRQLIALLRADARASVAALAQTLKRGARHGAEPAGASSKRDGTIAGYTVRLKPQVEEHRIRA